MGVNESPADGIAGPDPPRTGRGTGASTGTGTGAARVEIGIGTLVLNGFGRGVDGDRVAASFRAELTRLVERDGVPLAEAAGDRRLLREALTGLPPLPPTTSPAGIGEALARAVHAGLSGQGHPPGRNGGRR